LTFSPEFHADLSRYKEMRIHCTSYKKTSTLLTASLRPFGPGRKNFNTRSDFGLHTPVKFYLDPLRFAGVIRHIIPSRYTESVCTVMFHTQTKILNYC